MKNIEKYKDSEIRKFVKQSIRKGAFKDSVKFYLAILLLVSFVAVLFIVAVFIIYYINK